MFRFLALLFIASIVAAAPSTSEHHHEVLSSASIIESQPDMDLLLQQRREASLTPNFCMSGYVMDTYCIKLGNLLDKPTLRSLQYPDQHSSFCLLTVPQCIASGYELLSAPMTAGGDYGRAAKLDAMGNYMFTSLALQLGNCSLCSANGTVVEGLNFTVIGYMANNITSSDGTPPNLNVTSVLPVSAGCSNFSTTAMNMPSSPTAPVSTPTSPLSSPIKTSSAGSVVSVVSSLQYLISFVVMSMGLMV